MRELIRKKIIEIAEDYAIITNRKIDWINKLSISEYGQLREIALRELVDSKNNCYKEFEGAEISPKIELEKPQKTKEIKSSEEFIKNNTLPDVNISNKKTKEQRELEILLSIKDE